MSLTTLESASTVTPENLVHQLNWRYATKKFDAARKIPAETWDALEQSLVLSPSSFGLQPWKFIAVTDPELRKKLKGVSWNQSQIVDASHLVVLARRKDLNEADVDRYMKRIAAVRRTSADSLAGFRKVLADFVNRPKDEFDAPGWAGRQVYIALGTLLTSAALLGVDACPMEGIEPKAYDEILGLNGQGYETLAVAALGYRAEDDKSAALPKVRFKAEDVVAHV